MKINKDTVEVYNCIKCGHEWSYYPYDFLPNKHNMVCPLCASSLFWALKEIWNTEKSILALINYTGHRYIIKHEE